VNVGASVARMQSRKSARNCAQRARVGFRMVFACLR
jgi:hypothetical protein